MLGYSQDHTARVVAEVGGTWSRYAPQTTPMITLPATLVASVDRWEPPKPTQWLTQLPMLVESLTQRWSLTLGPAYQPGGEVSWVAPARDSSGRKLVLKLSGRHPEDEHEAAGLRAWQGRGAVEVHDTHVEDSTSALLLKRCIPATFPGSPTRWDTPAS